VEKYSWIPRRGLLQNVEPFNCPPDGLTYCRNFNYSRKDGTLTKSKGKEKLTSSAAASGTSIRGIGVQDLYANPNQFNPTHSSQCNSSTDDVWAIGATGFETTSEGVRAGRTGTTVFSTAVSANDDDVYVNHTNSEIYKSSQKLYFGGPADTGIRFASVNIDNAATIISAYLKIYQLPILLLGSQSIRGENSDNSSAFSTYNNFILRSKTTAFTSLAQHLSLAGQWVSYNVTSIVQEIVNRVGWTNNNAMTFLLGNNRSLVSSLEMYSRERGYPAQLVITAGSTGQVSSHIGLFFEGFDNLSRETTIYSARIKYRLNSQQGTPTLRVYGHNVDQSTTFTSRADWDTRQGQLTTAYVDWTPETNDMNMESWHYSPNLKDIIQEIVDRADWNDATDGDLSLFVKDNSTSDDNTFLDMMSYDGDENYGPYLEIESSATNPTSSKVYFWAASVSDAHMYDISDPATAVDQAGMEWAYEKRSSIFRFLQFRDADYSNNYLLCTDRKNYIQKLDRVTEDTATTDLSTSFKAKYLEDYQRRVIAANLDISGLVYKKAFLYSNVDDPTVWDTTNQLQYIPGSDEITGVHVMKNICNIYGNGSVWYIDYDATASDPDKMGVFCHTTAFGNLAANIGIRENYHFILTEAGIGAYSGGGNLEIISDGIREDLEYVLRSNLSNIVYIKYHPKYDELWVAHPVSGFDRNVVISRFSFKTKTWTQDDIKEANVLEWIYDSDDNFNGKMIFGAEDGYLFKEGSESNDGSGFSGTIISGPLYLMELVGKGNKRNRAQLNELQVWQNQSLSNALNIYIKTGDYPWEWDSAVWSSAYTFTDTNPVTVDEHGAWFGIKIESPEVSEKCSVSQIDFMFEVAEEYA